MMAHPALIYIAVSVAASTAEIWIGTLSEYRYVHGTCDRLRLSEAHPLGVCRLPYPLTTTQIHLALLIGIVVTGRRLWRIFETAGRSHLSAQPATASDDPTAPRRNAATPPEQRASPASSAPLGPGPSLGLRLAIVLCWSSLLAIETPSRLRIDPAFWSLVRLAPLAIAFLYSAVSPSRRRNFSKWHLLSIALLVRSWQPAWTSSSYQDWLVGAAWAVAAVTWVAALRFRHRTTEDNAPLHHRLASRAKAS